MPETTAVDVAEALVFGALGGVLALVLLTLVILWLDSDGPRQLATWVRRTLRRTD